MSTFKGILTAGLLIAATTASAQYRNYSLRCLAPLLDNIDPTAPKTLQEAFLIGPTRYAELRDGVGRGAIDFPISTQSPDAQSMFEQGIALLHTFAYREAEQAFRTVVELDPDCPMGYWGLAQATERTPGLARVYASAAAERCDRNFPELEQRWTTLLRDFYENYDSADLSQRSLTRVRALEELALDFPDHREVEAFLIRRLSLDPYLTGLPLTSPLGVTRMAEAFASEAPEHPSRHYQVFLWMNRRPETIIPTAVEMPALSPTAAEIWRFTSNAHLKAGLSDIAAVYGEAALRADHAMLSQLGLMPWNAQNLFENYEALIDQLANAGRINQALEVATAATRLPRELSVTDTYRWPAHLYVRPLMISGQWERLLSELETHPVFATPPTLQARASKLEWTGLAYAASGEIDAANHCVERLNELEREALIAGVSTATEQAMAASRKRLSTVLRILSDTEDRTLNLKQADLPPLVKAHFYELAGNFGAAFLEVQYLVEENTYQWLPTAVYGHLGMKAGHSRDALYRIDRRFRTDASRADRQLPVMKQLDPLVAELGLPTSWQIPAEPMTIEDLEHASGPAEWIPPTAPSFELPDRLEQNFTLAQFSGKPLLIQFFLGTQCAFCLEQFDTFQPHWPAFQEAGIEPIAISINSVEELKQTLGEDKEIAAHQRERFPFPILADPELSIFKSYGVFDQFEAGPMHATVLVSPEGKILWQNVSHDPFSQPEALLAESKRLLTAH